jgi:pimeloyl-ACP methyl ester carboxylesterase
MALARKQPIPAPTAPSGQASCFDRRWAAGIALVLVMSAMGCADGLLLQPSCNPIECKADRRTVEFEGGELEIWTVRGRQPEGAAPDLFILSFIGCGDRAEEWAALEADTWSDSSAEIWVVNYPGYGRSTGPAALERIPPSALVAYDELRKVASDRPIVVSGNSLGCTVALHVAASRPVAGAVLRNPPPLRSLILGEYGWWNLWIGAAIVAVQVPSELDSSDNAQKVRTPALFISASDDDVVPPSYQQNVIDAYAGQKQVVLFEGGHDSYVGPGENATLKEALRWLAAESRSAVPRHETSK